eukprot:IDg6285t1
MSATLPARLRIGSTYKSTFVYATAYWRALHYSFLSAPKSPHFSAGTARSSPPVFSTVGVGLFACWCLGRRYMQL